MTRMSVGQIQDKKKQGQIITMLTAYDYPLASLVDQAGIDIILVGDSVANVVLGCESTLEVGMTEMIHHAKAVNRAVQQALLIGDMPFESYQKKPQDAVVNARRFIDEAGCDAVKLEWFEDCLPIVEAIVKAGIPVMGHVGLTPQTAEKLGGFKVQGKDAQSAKKIMADACALEEKGCFSIVCECVPTPVAEMISKKLIIPTIGIGAGGGCDGQVLVTHDLLGLFDRYQPKFVKQYVNLSSSILDGLIRFRNDVQTRKFPDLDHSYSMRESELDQLK